MAFGRIGKAIIEVETKILHWLIASVIVLWGGWLLLVDHKFWPNLDTAFSRYGNPLVWAWATLFVGLFALFALVWHYPKFRSQSAALMTTYFSCMSYLLLAENRFMFFGWLSVLLAIFSGLIVLHRSAVEAKTHLIAQMMP